jgi:hypothetical protein
MEHKWQEWVDDWEPEALLEGAKKILEIWSDGSGYPGIEGHEVMQYWHAEIDGKPTTLFVYAGAQPIPNYTWVDGYLTQRECLKDHMVFKYGPTE